VSRVAAVLLLGAGVVHVVLGVAGITGADRLEANVREINTSPSGGELYFSLGSWGLILGAVGGLEVASAVSLHRVGARARLFGLIAGFLAMGAVFFSLPIFRWPSAATILALLAATYVLTYRLPSEA